MKIFKYRFFGFPLLHSFNAAQILKGRKKVSLDLGLSEEEIEDCGNKVRIREFYVKKKDLEKIVKDKRNFIWCLNEDGLLKLLFFEKAVYKLRLVSPNTAPTLEINGIHMHRIKGITPWEDSKMKVSALGVKGCKVLDVCTGLGYTAILARRLGAKKVLSIEKDQNVLTIAQFNPWSKGLEKTRIIKEDAFLVLDELSSTFDRVLLDPPRESLARNLYSRKFYEKIFSILEKGGKLLHYTGEPGVKRGRIFWKEIVKKLKDVGFKRVEYLENIKGIVAFKS